MEKKSLRYAPAARERVIPVTGSATPMERRFIPHLHSFRGLAIFAIVTGHGFAIAPTAAGSFDNMTPAVHGYRTVIETLTHGSTVYFALISGLLFSLVLRDRGWGAFFRGKFLNVACPYIVATIIFALLRLFKPHPGEVFEPSVASFASDLVHHVFLGTASPQLWYIPVLFLLYAFTPAVSFVLDHTSLRWIFWAMLVAPLFSSRVWPGFSIATPVYFLGVYVLGMYLGRDYEQWITAIRARIPILLVTVGITTFGAALCYQLNVGKLGFVTLADSFIYVQKVCAGLVVLAWFHQLEDRLPQWLNPLSQHSFPIYLFHYVLLIATYVIFFDVIKLPATVPLLFVAGIFAIVSGLLGPMYLSMGLKRLCKSRSRMLFGA